MEIYIEYAFLENFIYDGVLLFLSVYAVKIKCSLWRICFSAMLGAVFALVFPLLSLSGAARAVLKLSVGCLMCMPVVGKFQTRKDWRRYGLVTALFLGLSFGFGGALLGLYRGFGETNEGFSLTRIPSYVVFLGFAGLSAINIAVVKRLYARKAVLDNLYACTVSYGENQVCADGFLDSGNLAFKNGLPVCFLSPDLLYDIWGKTLFFNKDSGQVCDEMKISTVTGERIITLYLGEIEIKTEGKSIKTKAYFAVLPNSISREYKVLLNARMFEGSCI